MANYYAERANQSIDRICPQCKKQCYSDWNTCSYCGSSLLPSPDQDSGKGEEETQDLSVEEQPLNRYS